MRTTITLPDAVFRRAKATVAMQGRSLREFITMAVVHELERETADSADGYRAELPLVPSKRPGSLRITEDEIHKALSEDDSHVLA